MAIEVPEGVQGLFLVLTGEQWPTANEDALREVGNAWGTAGDRLENELAPYLLKAVQTIRGSFTGKSAIKFADMMAPYVADPPHYIPQAAEQFRDLKKFLLNASAQVEYVKIISIEELVLLIAQIAWAIAMAFWTDGASMTWLAARMAIVRFLLKTLWGRLILQFALAELFGIAFQLALDVLTQAIQFAKHHRTEWDVQATISAVEVGAVGGLLSIPFSAISHFVSHHLTTALSRALSREIDLSVLQPVVVRAVNDAARNLENTPLSKVSKDIASNLLKTAEKPLRVKLVEIGLPALIHMAEEGLHEAITEGTVMAMNGQGFKFNPFSFTSGVAGSVAGQIGHGVGHILATPKPVREGYSRLGEGDGEGKSLLSDEDTLSETTSLSDTTSLSGSLSGSTTLAEDASESGDSEGDPFDDRYAVPPTSLSRSPSMSSTTSSDGSSNGTSSGTSSERGTPPPPPPKDAAARGDGSTGAPPVPPKDRASSTSSSRSSTGDLTRSPSSSPSSSSTSSPSRGRGDTDEGASSTRTTPSSRTPGMNGRPEPSTSSSREQTASAGTEGTSRGSSSNGTGTSRSSTGAGKEGAAQRPELGSRNPYRDASRSSTTTPNGTGPSRPAEDESTANRPERGTGNLSRDASRSSTTTPRGAGQSRSGGTAAESTAARAGQESVPSSQNGRDTSSAEGTTREDNPFRKRAETATPASPRPAAPGTHTELPAAVTQDAAVVNVAHLASVTAADVSLSRRLVVEGEGTVPAGTVRAAAQRTGVEVVARVDRAQAGYGRRPGARWMSFPPDGGRPRLVEGASVPVTSVWSQPRLADDRFREGYPWLPKINPGYATDDDFLNNCLLAAIGTDLTLEEAFREPDEDPALLAYFQVSPDGKAPWEYLTNMGKGEPVDVPGYQAIVDAMSEAGHGARGMVVVGTGTNDTDHVYNVVNGKDGIVFLDGQKGVQATLPRTFRSLQFLPTSEGFPHEAISVNPTPWPRGRFVAGESPVATDASSSFSGRGVRLGESDGTAPGVRGVSRVEHEAAAARRADAQAKAEKEGAAPRPAAPRRDRSGPVTIDDVRQEGTTPTTTRDTTPFTGEGRTLGKSKGKGTGIPGLDERARREAKARRAKAQKEARERVGPTPKSGARPFGARDAVTIHDLPPETTPNPFPGTGRTVGKGDGKGTGIPGLSDKDREKSAAERLKRGGSRNPAGTPAEPFSGTGRTVGESDGTSTGIPGLAEKDRLEAEARRTKAQEERRQQETAPFARAEPEPGGATPRRDGKGFGGDPATLSDLPEDRPQEERPEPIANTTGETTPAAERFPGVGQVVGEGDGRGARIPGLDNETRERARAERAKRGETAPKRRVYTPPKKQVTLGDLRADEDAAGKGTSSGGRFQQQRGAGTTTLLETQPKPGPARADENAGRAPKAAETEGTAPADLRDDESKTTTNTNTNTNSTNTNTGRSNTSRSGRAGENANEQGKPPPYTAASSHAPSSAASAASRGKEPAETAGEPPSRSASPPPPYTASETAPQDKSTDDEEITEARAVLAALDGERRADVMSQAQMIVTDLDGRLAAATDPGARLGPVDRAALRVAAELATSGRDAADGLARRLVHAMAEKPAPASVPKRVPRVTVDNDRIDLARTTLSLLQKVSKTQTTQILNEARVIVERMAGRRVSLAPDRPAGDLPIVWLLAAAEIPWAGHQAAEDLVADVLGVPRSKPGSPSRWVQGFATAARNDPDRARATLGLIYHKRAEGSLAEADAIIAETEPLRAGDERARRRNRLMIAAEIARSGPDAGRALATELADHASESARRSTGPRKKVTWADDEPETEHETKHETDAGVKPETEDQTDEENDEEEDWNDDEEESQEDQDDATDERHVPEPMASLHTDETSSPAAEQLPIEEIFRETRVGMLDGRTVALWLPGAPENGPKFDAATIERIGDVIPDGTVFVFGEAKDGKLVARGREISVDALAAIIGSRAPEQRPLLLISGAGAVAEPLSRALDQPVLATPYEAAFDPRRGPVVFSRSRDEQDAAGEKAEPADAWFRVYVPGDSNGMHVVEGPPSAPPYTEKSKGQQDSGSEKKDEPKDRGKRDDEDRRKGSRKDSSRRPDGEPEPEPEPSSEMGEKKRPEREDRPKPDPEDPYQALLEPILADPMIRAIGIPRAGLPMMAELIEDIRDQLDAAGARYSDNDMNLLAHRLLANYPYLLGAGTGTKAGGLMVPMGGAELLITLNPKNPHRMRNPGGSTLVPSTLEPVDKDHHAVDTINATYATGAHVQTRSGQTSATRGAVSVSFGVGATPGILQVVKFSASISGTTNQSNRSTTHIADAEGGHVEDNRTDADLLAYTPNWSFKLRTNPNTSWNQLPANRVSPGRNPEKLLLWVPQHYLELAPKDQVTAIGKEVKSDRLPDFYVASGLTNIPKLFDQIVGLLHGQGLELPINSLIRQELLHKLWNLNAHLDDAVNLNKGYRITLHNKYGRPIARVKVNSERVKERSLRVGATSNLAHIENVRTAIDGMSGGHTVTNTSTVTPLAVEFDLLPNPTGLPDVGLGISASASYTSTNAEGISTGRVGLNVLVPRNTSNTAAYDVSFDHTATVSVRGNRPANAKTRSKPVRGKALLRMPEALAYDHGFSVDRDALKDQDGGTGATRKWEPDAIRGTGRRDVDPATKTPPGYVRDGRGVGMGLVMVDDSTVAAVENEVKTRLRAAGFLPANEDDPFAGYSWSDHGNKTDSRIDNLELVDKMISRRGLESHHDQIRQGGKTFTVHKRSGGMGMDLDVDSARVTIRARRSATTPPPRYVRSTGEYHTVNLAMGMDSAGMSVAHSRKWAFGVKLKGLFKDLKTAMMGWEWQRIVGASDSVNMLNNRPELLEYPGVVDEYALTDDYEVTIEYQHSGRLRRGVRTEGPIPIPNQVSKAFLLPLGTTPGPKSTRRTTPHDVLDQGVVYYLDATGMREAAGAALHEITGPAGTADLDVSTFAGTIEMRSHMKEILAGEYTTDRLFDPGFFRDKFGSLDIRGEMGPSRFSGATSDKFVLGVIKLWLTEGKLTDSSSTGWTWDQLDVAVGGPAGHATLTGEADVNRHWQHNRSTGSGRSGGKELIQLDFNRVYSYETSVNLEVRSHQEKHSKLWPSGAPRNANPPVGPRTMVYLLPEPEALTRYADGTLPVSSRQLADALARWKAGELRLSGDVVARILSRWVTEVPTLDAGVVSDRADLAATLTRLHRSGGTMVVRDLSARRRFDGVNRNLNPGAQPLEPPRDPYDLPDLPDDLAGYLKGETELSDAELADRMQEWEDGTLPLGGDAVASILLRWRQQPPEDGETGGAPMARRDELLTRLAARLAELHTAGGLPIRSLALRERFNNDFWQTIEEAPVPFQHMEMPEYLTRKDPNGRFLGHSGIQDLLHDNGMSTYQLVKEKVDAVAPGMLAAGAEVWTRDGRRIGKMQGSIDALQSIFARGRDQAMWEDVLAKGGYSIYLVHPVGWLLSDVVEINLADVLTSQPEVYDFKPNTGLEDYGHGYIGTSRSKSRDGAQAVVGKFAPGYPKAGGDVNLKAGEGHHRGTTHAENAVTEQTVYDWSGHYRVKFRHQLTVTARRLKMPGRPLNNLLMQGFKKWTLAGREASETFNGTLNLQVPRALAEAGQIRGPAPLRDLRPAMKLPHNAYVTGVNIDLMPQGRALMNRMFGPRWYEKVLGARAGDEKTRSSLSLPVLLSRSHLTNHVREALAGESYKLADNLFIPGDSARRLTLSMDGDVYDMQVIGRMRQGTGTGRYIKHQSGTTASNTSDLNRLTGGYDLSGGGNLTDHKPETPQNTWGFNDNGSRTTALNQSSSGTENYRREQHAKEQGATLLVRMRGQFWLEAQKTSHNLFRGPSNDGEPVRSDPATGDVYVEMFEAQYNELREEMYKPANRAAAHWQLQSRVDHAAWAALADADRVDVTSYLEQAAADGVESNHIIDYLTERIRADYGAGRPLRLDFRRTERPRFHATTKWAVKTMTADLAAIRKANEDEKRRKKTDVEDVEEPDFLKDYRDYATMVPPDALPVGLADSKVDEEIADIINDVNTLHARRPDNRLGGPAPLPPELSLLSLDPTFLARDLAHELVTHVSINTPRADGTRQQSWADPSGRIYAFDPATPSGMVIPYDDAVRVGIMSEDLRRDAQRHDLSEVDLGSAYHGSWAEQQTFEQAVRAMIAERRDQLRSVHPSLPGLLDRVVAFRPAMSQYVAQMKARLDEQASLVAERRAAIERLKAQLRELRSRAQQLSGDPSQASALADLNTQIGLADEELALRDQHLRDERAAFQAAERDFGNALNALKQGDALVEGLRTLLGPKIRTSRSVWTDEVLQYAEEVAAGLEHAAQMANLGLGYRVWRADTADEALLAIERTLRHAGEGALSILTRHDSSGDAQTFTAVHHDGRIRWFEASSGIPVQRPLDGQDGGSVVSIEIGADGMRVRPTAEMYQQGAINFGRVRSARLADLAGELGDGGSTPHTATPVLSRTATLAKITTKALELSSGMNTPVRSSSPGLTSSSRRIVDLSEALRGRLPVNPHLYVHTNGGHGVGRPRTTQAGWQEIGAIADYAPILWLTQGTHGRSMTAEDVIHTDLRGAVAFLRDNAVNATTRVERMFTGLGRAVETRGQLPTGLPEGTWVWFDGLDGSGAIVRTSDGFLVYTADGEEIEPQTEAQVRAAFGTRLHQFVIGRPPVGGKAGPHDRPGFSHPLQFAAKPDGALPTAATPQHMTVDFPLPNDPHLYINDQGEYRVAAPGTAGEWHHLGAFSEYAPISWLIGSRTSQGVSASDTVHNDLNEATRFLDATARTGDRAAAIRSFLQRVSGRRTEVVTTLPADLPGDTWIYYIGPNGRGAAAVVLQDGSVQRHIAGAVQTFGGGLSSGTTGTFVIARPKTAARSRSRSVGGLSGRSLSAAELGALFGTGRRRGGSLSSQQSPTAKKKPAGTASGVPKGGKGAGQPGPRRKETGQADTDQTPLSDKARGKRRAGGGTVEDAAQRALEHEWMLEDPDVLDATLNSHGLTRVEVPGDNNCFYHTLLAVAGPYLAAQIPRLQLGRTDRLAVRANIRLLRNWLADRLQADFNVAAQGLPSRYADFFHMEEDIPVNLQQADLVDQVRTMDSWHNEAGDAVAEVAARELGLPLTLIQGRYNRDFGPAAAERIYFIRTPGHFLGARPTDEAAITIDTSSLQVAARSSIAEGEQALQAAQNEQQQRLTAATTLFRHTLATVADHPAAQAGEYRHRLARHTADFNRALQGRHHGKVAAHLRAQARVTEMRQAAADIEEMVIELAVRFPAQVLIVPGVMTRFADRLEREIRTMIRQDPGYLLRNGAALNTAFPGVNWGAPGSGS